MLDKKGKTHALTEAEKMSLQQYRDDWQAQSDKVAEMRESRDDLMKTIANLTALLGTDATTGGSGYGGGHVCTISGRGGPALVHPHRW